MKTKLFQRIALIEFIVFIFSTATIITACKKEASTDTQSPSVTLKSDAVITVEPSILPPSTLQSFIAGGSTSNAGFQISTAKNIEIDQATFTAPSLVSYAVVSGSGIPNVGGYISTTPAQLLSAGAGMVLPITVHYLNVADTTSGSIVSLKLQHIVYRTDDEVYHDFYPSTSGDAPQMCVVYNLPSLELLDPQGDTLGNGYKEIALLQLSGDTSWTLNSLPLHLYSPFEGQIRKSELLVKINRAVVPTTSDSFKLKPIGGTAETLINFTNGFKHKAGRTDTLKIFAKVISISNDLIQTTMNPVSNFSWTDGLGVLIPNTKNAKFFKQQTGQANYH